MKMKMKWIGVALCGLVLAGCQMFSQPGGVDENGNTIAPTTGLFDQATTAAATAGGLGVPYAGLAGWVLGIIGAAGTAITAKRRAGDAAVTVRLVDAMKNQAAEFKSGDDVKKLLGKISEANPAWGSALKRAWRVSRRV